MKNKLVFFSLAAFIATGLGCQDRPCREIQAEKMAKKESAQKNQPVAAASTSTSAGATAAAGAGDLKVKVYKADGSLQCGMGNKIPLETMEKDLAGIKVYNRYNMNDGLMRIQVCGAPTGQSNVYEISRSDLEKALKAGFKEWTQE
jgi:hypothetical protein